MRSAALVSSSVVVLAVCMLAAGACGTPAPSGAGKPEAAAGASPITPGKLTVCTYGGFAPVCYKDSQGQLVGYDVSFLGHFADSQGLSIATIERDFNDIWTLPGKNECDVAGAGVMQRDDRPVGPDARWSDAYFEVQRSLLVRTEDQAAFDDYQTLEGKKIVVTRGSTADTDAKARYPRCAILYVDEVVPPEHQADAQGYIVRELIAKGKADAFGEGDVSNSYLRDFYASAVPGGLALADVHPIADGPETFNFVSRNASGIHEQLDAFIAKYEHCYQKDASCYVAAP